MERNKLIYFLLLLVCIALILYAAHLFLSRAELSQPMRSMFFRQDNEYVVILDITNSEPETRNYTISVLVDGKRYDENISLSAGRLFTYKHHVYPPLQDKRVNVTVYGENETVVVSKNTYVME